jgi:lambda family phage portal protein
MDRLNVRTQKRDGEYFIHILRGAQNPYGIAWRVLRPDWCDHTYHMSRTASGTIIHCGVEMIEETRRPIAYYFHTTPTSVYTFNGRGQPLARIAASDIIHGFTQHDEDQPRGIPEGHAGMVKLKMLEELDRAELTAARDDACSTRSYEADRDASMEGFKDLTQPDNEAAGRALIAEKEPGQQIILPPGWREKINTPQHPNGNHGVFKSGLNKDVASAFDIEYSNAFNDWAGVSFSSVRVGTISERDAWIIAQNDFISQCKTPQFLAWLQSFLALSASGSLPATKLPKFAEHSFRGRRWMWVDPMKDMNAAKMARDHGWKTDTQITEDLGGDYDENQEQAARDRGTRQKHGNPEPQIGNGNMPKPEKGEDDENEKQAAGDKAGKD